MGNIPPVDRSKQTLTDGSPVKPYRDSYVHDKCGALTKMGRALSETYARDPYFYSGTFCVGCGAHFDLDQFHWEDGEPMAPYLQETWATAQKQAAAERERSIAVQLERTERAELARLKAKYEGSFHNPQVKQGD